jgi:hypothetical protein
METQLDRVPVVRESLCRPPGEWEVFEISFRAPRFDESGKLIKPAGISMLHNGIRVYGRGETDQGDHR